MARKIDEMPEYRAKLPRNQHVLSHDFGFTCTTGHLLPVFHDLLQASEKISLGFEFDLRTMPLVDAAFCRLTTHTEYFFVPIQLLYQPFENVYYQINEQFSSLFEQPNNIQSDFPVLDLNYVAGDAVRYRLWEHRADVFNGESIGQNYLRLFDMLDYSSPDKNYDDWLPNVFPYALLAYNCIYQYNYRLDNREKFDAESFNWDKYYNVTTPITTYPWLYCRLHYRPLASDYFTDVKVSPIVDTLNLNSADLQAAKDWLSSNQNISKQTAAGQGKVTTFGQTIVSTVGEQQPMQSPSKARYSTNLLPWQASDTALTVATGGNVKGDIYQLNIDSPHYHQSASPSGTSAFNTANIRALFATEKLWSVTGRARKNYDAQTLAHFGFKVPHDVKHQITKFGHDVSHINIGEVIATGAGDGVPLGEIAGKGYGHQENRMHQFTAPCHGVVMVLFSVTVDRNYEAGFPKYNVLTSRNDMYIPEYDNLGMQPLFGYESGQGYTADSVMGWQYRYEQWKRRYNRVSPAFRNDRNGSLASWIPSFRPPSVVNASIVTDSFQYFLNRPDDVNQLMLAQYPTQWSEAFEQDESAIYDNDPFVVHSHINAVLNSPMSDFSLPRLDA